MTMDFLENGTDVGPAEVCHQIAKGPTFLVGSDPMGLERIVRYRPKRSRSGTPRGNGPNRPEKWQISARRLAGSLLA